MPNTHGFGYNFDYYVTSGENKYKRRVKGKVGWVEEQTGFLQEFYQASPSMNGIPLFSAHYLSAFMRREKNLVYELFRFCSGILNS